MVGGGLSWKIEVTYQSSLPSRLKSPTVWPMPLLSSPVPEAPVMLKNVPLPLFLRYLLVVKSADTSNSGRRSPSISTNDDSKPHTPTIAVPSVDVASVNVPLSLFLKRRL